MLNKKGVIDMKLELNQKELSILTHLISIAENDDVFNETKKIKVFLGAGDGSDDHWIDTESSEFYDLYNKIQNSLDKEFKVKDGA
jgi:hypothetical protein